MNPTTIITSLIPKKPQKRGPDGGGEWLYVLAGFGIAGLVLLVGYFW